LQVNKQLAITNYENSLLFFRQLAKIPYLEQLDMSFSTTFDLEFKIDCPSFHSMPYLKNLRLFGVDTSGKLKPYQFSSFPQLEVLDLRYNSITNIEDGAFNGLDSLELLDLSHNNLKDFNSYLLHGLPNLKTLKLI
jgi:Leucine-rich repeat (LRR) protein